MHAMSELFTRTKLFSRIKSSSVVLVGRTRSSNVTLHTVSVISASCRSWLKRMSDRSIGCNKLVFMSDRLWSLNSAAEWHFMFNAGLWYQKRCQWILTVLQASWHRRTGGQSEKSPESKRLVIQVQYLDLIESEDAKCGIFNAVYFGEEARDYQLAIMAGSCLWHVRRFFPGSVWGLYEPVLLPGPANVRRILMLFCSEEWNWSNEKTEQEPHTCTHVITTIAM